MDRRTFLRATAIAGLASTAPWVFPRALKRTTAQDAVYRGPFWIFVSAAGGWDPRFMFDPIEDPEQNRMYTGVGSTGSIRYAPIGLDYERLQWEPASGVATHVLTAEQFLERHGQRLAVVNGIDTTTNNHEGGSRAMSSGQLGLGYPALGALIAAANAPSMPMAFFSGGGYDFTGGHIPLTRVSNASAFSRIARPNEINAGSEDPALFHTQETMSRIERFQRARTAALRDAQRLPTIETSMRDLLAARASTAVLDRFEMPEETVDLAPGEVSDLESFMRQGQMLIAAFKSGLSATGSIRFGGFDTHGNHDRDQSRQVLKLYAGIDYLLAEAERNGFGDELYIVATSDFGRGPRYNGENGNAGKDHWPITSMFALGPGIAGNRVVGATDDRQLARAVDPDTLEVDDSGVKIGPGDVHRALRRIATMDDHELGQLYPLSGRDLNLFG